MKITDEFNWGYEDFIVMGILVFGAISMFIVTSRVVPRKYRAVIAIGILIFVMWLWAELAVGVFTTWGS